MLEQLGGQIGQNQPLVRSTAAEACALGGCGHVLSCSNQRITAGAHWMAPLLCGGSRVSPPLLYGGSRGSPPCSILFSLAEVDLVFVQVVVAADGAQRVEAWRAVLQRQAHLMQLELHLVDRLRAKISDVQQVLLTTRHQLRHR